MSKIGQRPISIPADVTISLDSRAIAISGPKGRLSWSLPSGIEARNRDGYLIVTRDRDADRAKSLHGLARAMIANMIEGVAEGYTKQLKIIGVGYRAETTATGLRLTLGFSHPIDFPAPPGITFTVDKNLITVAGCDKQLVGETAARIRSFKKPEPYKGKGIMCVDEVIRRKAGKAAKTVRTGDL